MLLSIESKISSIVEPLTQKSEKISLAIGIITQEGIKTFFFGKPYNSSDKETSEHTVFEIGSLTKIFTSTLIGLLIEEKYFTLDTPLKVILPELESLPDELTIKLLLTHSSGLPMMPSNLLKHFLRHPKNPYSTYKYSDLDKFIASHKFKDQTYPATYCYSNIGYSLLGEVIMKATGMGFENAISTKLAELTGIYDTKIALSDTEREDFAQGYSKPGKKTSPWNLGALEASGGLRSNLKDMINFLSYQLNSTRMLPYHATFASADEGKNVTLGGWLEENIKGTSTKMLYKDGVTSGFRCIAGFIREKKSGVVVLSNLGFSLIDAFKRHGNEYTAEEVGFALLKELGESD